VDFPRNSGKTLQARRRRPHRNHSPALKAEVAVAAIKGEKTLIDSTKEFVVHPNQIKQWQDQLLEGATGVFWSCRGFGTAPLIT
jgi:transposase